ncbi:unnamed protein product [Owenia fusiformis]|uniref:Protein AAR2 homolog n=1 Tax=Owenia fusiformis TaxID=6347 RepID=A0A8J1XTY2_OWEFU|nr:unnamed protein product [Owenia fusiformis]
MDQETAQILFSEGAVLVLLDVPPGTEFGIDYNAWNTGPNFKGVKMIPPGIHFVYYSARSGRGSDVAPRSGFFYNFKAKEVLVKKWDRLQEDITSGGVSQEEVERIQSNKKELDRYLGAYPYESYKKWVSMTNHITEPVMESLQPINKTICSVAQFVSERSDTKTRKEDAIKTTDKTTVSHDDDDPRLPKMDTIPGTQIRFSEIPKKKYPEGATPSEITKYSIDSSYVTVKIIQSKNLPSNHILGEVQFAFICFLIGQTYDAFEQWKLLVHMLCTSEEAMADYPALYNEFISMLHFQIKDIPEDFFIDIVSRNNFLTSTLQLFFSNLESSGISENVLQRGLKFRDNLTKRFKWDFTTELDEDAPVVVE